MKVADLIGAPLDAAVAAAEGITGLVEKDGRMCHAQEWDPEGMAWRDSLKDWVMWVDYAPSQRWDHGGPIIEREKVTIRHEGNEGWGATVFMEHDTADYLGPTPLVAAMRAYVSSKFGDAVPPPLSSHHPLSL